MGAVKFRATQPPASAKGGLIAWLEAEKTFHLGLCDALEALADQLPTRVDYGLVCGLLGQLERSWQDHLASHEQLVAPLLKANAQQLPGLADELALLEREHDQISGSTDEMIEQLTQLSEGDRVNYETLGYILRCGFEGRRRHFEWEMSFIGRTLLSSGAKLEPALIEAWCATHPRPSLPQNLRVKLLVTS